MTCQPTTCILWVPKPTGSLPYRTDPWIHHLVGERTAAMTPEPKLVYSMSEDDRHLPIFVLPLLYPKPGEESLRHYLTSDSAWRQFWEQELRKDGSEPSRNDAIRRALDVVQHGTLIDVKTLKARVQVLVAYAAGVAVSAKAMFRLYHTALKGKVIETAPASDESDETPATRSSSSKASDLISQEATLEALTKAYRKAGHNDASGLKLAIRLIQQQEVVNPVMSGDASPNEIAESMRDRSARLYGTATRIAEDITVATAQVKKQMLENAVLRERCREQRKHLRAMNAANRRYKDEAKGAQRKVSALQAELSALALKIIRQ